MCTYQVFTTFVATLSNYSYICVSRKHSTNILSPSFRNISFFALHKLPQSDAAHRLLLSESMDLSQGSIFGKMAMGIHWMSSGQEYSSSHLRKKNYNSNLQESCDDESLGYRRTLDRPHCVAWTTASCREKLQRSQGAMSGFLSTRECICLDPLQTTLKEMRQRTLNTRSWLPWIQLSHNLVMVYELAEGLEAKAFKHRNANNSGPCSKLQNL